MPGQPLSINEMIRIACSAFFRPSLHPTLLTSTVWRRGWSSDTTEGTNTPLCLLHMRVHVT